MGRKKNSGLREKEKVTVFYLLRYLDSKPVLLQNKLLKTAPTMTFLLNFDEVKFLRKKILLKLDCISHRPGNKLSDTVFPQTTSQRIPPSAPFTPISHSGLQRDRLEGGKRNVGKKEKAKGKRMRMRQGCRR